MRPVATDRLPTGLSLSAFIAILSLGAVALWGGFRQQRVNGPEDLVHTMAGLCLLWSVVAYVVSRVVNSKSEELSEAGGERAAFQAAAKRGWGIGHDLISVLQIASMVTGLLAVIVMLYISSIELLCRTVYLEYEFPWRVKLWRTGLIDAGLLGASLAVHWLRTRHEHLIVAMFWLLIFASIWVSCRIPSHRPMGVAGGIWYAVPSNWASVLMALMTGAILVWTLAEGRRFHVWRMTAWPNALKQLAAPPVSWPGFHYSAGVIAAVVLCLGCMYIVVPWTIVSAFLAGGSMLALAHREWNENLADAGLALLTLGVVSLCMLGLDMPRWSPHVYAEILNRALIGLAIMTGFWHWLARNWKQQLDNGEPWTTAGRLIRPVRRVGFLVSVTAVWVSLHLSFWPQLPFVTDRDVSVGRWVLGILAHGLLISALLSAIYDTNRRTLGWLVLFAIMSLAAFVLVRASDSWFGQLYYLYWPLLMTGVAAAALLVVSLLSRTSQWRAMIEPLVFTGILIAPLSAVAGMSMAEHLSLPPWLPAATYGCLTAVYLLAAIVPGPVTFSIVAVFCGVAGTWYLRRFVGSNIFPTVYFYCLLCGVSLGLTAVVYRHQMRADIARVLKWVGGSMVLIAVVGRLVVALM